jgi:HEAT repeat protein
VLLNDPEPAVRRVAAETIEALGPAFQKPGCLSARLADESTDIRLAAARTLLKHHNPGDASACRVLIAVATNKQGGPDCEPALHALRGAGPEAQAQAVAVLIPRLPQDNVAARAQAIEALISLGPAAHAALPALRRLSRDEHARARGLAALALLEIGGEGEPYDPELHAAIVSDPLVNLDQRGELLQTLLTSSPASVSKVAGALIRQLGDAQPSVREEALELLRRISDVGPVELPE